MPVSQYVPLLQAVFSPKLDLKGQVHIPSHSHLSQRYQSVFQSRSVFQSNLKWDRGALKLQEKLVDYANTTNVEFTVDPKVLFHGRLIYSYLQIFKLIKCQWSVQICSLTTLWHDRIVCIDNTACPGRKQHFYNEHALNHEPVMLAWSWLTVLKIAWGTCPVKASWVLHVSPTVALEVWNKLLLLLEPFLTGLFVVHCSWMVQL